MEAKEIWVAVSRPDPCGNTASHVIGAWERRQDADAALIAEFEGLKLVYDPDCLGITVTDEDGMILAYLQQVRVVPHA